MATNAAFGTFFEGIKFFYIEMFRIVIRVFLPLFCSELKLKPYYWQFMNYFNRMRKFRRSRLTYTVYLKNNSTEC